MRISFYTLVIILIASINITAQNWITTGGNMQKNGLSKITGPSTSNQYWQVNSTNNTLWGNSVFTWGNKFVTSRVTFTPSYRAKLELRDLTSGALIWEKQIADTSIMYAVGFNEDAVYANDYKTGKLYSLNITDGSVKWFVTSAMFGGNMGLCFTPIGDIITYGKRINKMTGAVMWTNNYIIPVGPDESYCLYGNTYYHWTGSIVTPKKLIAIDINSGATKYTSQDLPGDGDQENDLIIGPDGVIYITRDGGALYAFADNGSGFQLLWSNPAQLIVKGFAKDGTVLSQSVTGRLVRINRSNGNVIDSTTSTYGSQLYTRIATAADSTIFLNNGEIGTGKYFALTPNLQTEKWSFNAPYNYYSCPSLGKEGVMILIGAGTSITAYKTTSANLKPVADFYARSASFNNNITYPDMPVNFFEQSSYNATSWLWSFPGSMTPTSSQQNPTNILYLSTGVYNVTLVATNGFGQDTLLRSEYISVINLSGITNLGGEIPKSYALYQNYPNPFNPTTKIKFGLSKQSMVKLTVYDITGKLAGTLINEPKAAGNYEVEFNAENLSSGAYFYKIEVGEFTDIKKMILLK